MLYEGTSLEQPDPRPPLDAAGNEPLRLWVAMPDSTSNVRPAIVWLHGGGFAVGIDSMYGLANGTGGDHASRGYVGFSVEYRTDTTLIGEQEGDRRPPSLCQWVQDNEDPADPVWVQRRDQCRSGAVPYACIAQTVTAARAAGGVAELTSDCDTGGHAAALYAANRAATDAQWTTFLARELRIYSRLRPPSADPVGS
jgi:hypothetical protein